jgi:methylated-DNA-[protein]-cysteine S-methyltransferase
VSERNHREQALPQCRDENVAYRIVGSPIGPLTLVTGGDRLKGLLFGDHARPCVKAYGPGRVNSSLPVLKSAARQLEEYFAGDRTTFDIPLAPEGTSFQKRVWNALLTVPYGETASYADVARRVGDVRKARAVGAANGRNPIAIIVPCHRVIGSDGSLTGFGGGLPTKRFLLDLEAETRG